MGAKKFVRNSLEKKIQITDEFIGETLSIYKDENIYVNNASYYSSEIKGDVEISHYPFTKDEYIQYVTAPMIMLYLSQMGYLLVRCLVEDGIIPISLENFFKYRNQGKIMLCAFDDIKLKSKIYTIKKKFQLTVSLIYYHETKTGITGKVYFETENNEFSGFTTVQIYLS